MSPTICNPINFLKNSRNFPKVPVNVIPFNSRSILRRNSYSEEKEQHHVMYRPGNGVELEMVKVRGYFERASPIATQKEF